jgi:fatty-acyl-CoA synthase
VLEEGGYGRVVGRLKEMIIRDNTNIFPVEIEEFLMTLPDVMEVQVKL